jgi:hypothetical protein
MCPICQITRTEYEEIGCNNPRKGQPGCFSSERKPDIPLTGAEKRRIELAARAIAERGPESGGHPVV